MVSAKTIVRIFLLTVFGVAPLCYSAPIVAPTFTATFTDARTDDNQFTASGGKQRWDIDAGADSYQNEYYERPTTQTYSFDSGSGRYGASQYFANLDIVTARAGRDNQFLYIEINLVGNYFHKEDNTKDYEGLKYQYGFRFSNDPDGRGGYLMYGEFGNPSSQTSWTSSKTKGSYDSNNDIGGRGLSLGGPTGLNITKTDNSKEDGGKLDGYDMDIISDGKLSNNTEVLFIRMVGNSTVQFAMDYIALGLDTAYIDNIKYLDMEAVKGGPKDPQNYFWNDKYTFADAGSPNLADYNTGIQSPKNIYELDTIRGGYVPEPATLGLVIFSGIMLSLRRNR